MYKVKQAKAVWQVWCVDVVLEDRMDGKEVLYNVKVRRIRSGENR